MVQKGNRKINFIFFLVKIPAGKYLMELVAVDWLKNTKRMDHVARRTGCAAQVGYRCNIISFTYKLAFILCFHHLFNQVSKFLLFIRYIDSHYGLMLRPKSTYSIQMTFSKKKTNRNMNRINNSLRIFRISINKHYGRSKFV